jgi:hypothetical protein
MDDKVESRQESKYGTLSHTFPCLPSCWTPYYCACLPSCCTPYYCAPSYRRPSNSVTILISPPPCCRVFISHLPPCFVLPNFRCFGDSVLVLENGISLPSHAVAIRSLRATRCPFIKPMLRGISCGAGPPAWQHQPKKITASNIIPQCVVFSHLNVRGHSKFAESKCEQQRRGLKMPRSSTDLLDVVNCSLAC